MKKYRIQLIITIFIIFALAGMSHREASAYKIKVKVEKNSPYAEKIGDEMFAHAKKETRRGLRDYWKNKEEDYGNMSIFFGMKVTKKDTFILCKPYVYWLDMNPQQASYWFPVAVKGKIVSLLEVSGKIDEPKYMTAMLLASSGSIEEIESLNKLDYFHKDYVFFGYKGDLLAQGENGKIKKFLEYPQLRNEPDREPSDTEIFFRALDYDKKLELLLNKMDDFAFTEEVDAIRKAIVDGTYTGEEEVTSTFIPRQEPPEPQPDVSARENSGKLYIILLIAAVAGIVIVLLVILVIVKIKTVCPPMKK